MEFIFGNDCFIIMNSGKIILLKELHSQVRNDCDTCHENKLLLVFSSLQLKWEFSPILDLAFFKLLYGRILILLSEEEVK